MNELSDTGNFILLQDNQMNSFDDRFWLQLSNLL